MRLDKFLSNSGIGTRREVKNLLKLGVIEVNDQVIIHGDFQVNPDQDKVVVDGDSLTYQPFVYILLNKPAGYVSATEDRDDPTVLSLIEGFAHRDLHLVGRLDKDTTGLIILTDDGALTHHLTSPKHHVGKTYLVHVDQPLDSALVDSFSKGFRLGERDAVMPSTLTILDDKTQASLTIYEGKFHQIKRMFAKFGFEVQSLQRTALGPIQLGNLRVGEYRELTLEEIHQLKSL